MPKYSVMVTRTHSVESTTKIWVTATDKEAAQSQAQDQMSKATDTGKLGLYEWSWCSDEEDFDYEVDEA
jgi:hypothetical protein